MGFSFGGSSPRSGPTNQATASNFLTLGAINPQFAAPGSGFNNPTSRFLRQEGVPLFGSILQGVPGVQTFDSLGNPVAVGSNELPTLLPGISEIGRFDTVFEKFDQGNLSPSAAGLTDTFLTTAQNPVDPTAVFGDLISGVGSAFSGLGSVGQGLDPIEAKPIENIGQLTTNIINDLPPEFQEFITNTLEAGSPERTQENLDKFEEAISARAQQNADIIGSDLLDVFGAQGLGTAGAAVEAMKSLALQVTVEANAQIAAGQLNILEQQLQALQIGENLTRTLTSAGATEQANRVALQNAELQAKAAQNVAKINAQASLQSSLIAAQTSIQNNLIAQTAGLEQTRLGLLGQGFNTVTSQSSAEEQARINSLVFPFDLLNQVGSTTSSKGGDSGSGFDLSGLLQAGATLGAAAISSSDRRLKRNIKQIGYTHKGYPLYRFNYLWDDVVHISVMAQDVETIDPEAVIEINGFKYVDLTRV